MKGSIKTFSAVLGSATLMIGCFTNPASHEEIRETNVTPSSVGMLAFDAIDQSANVSNLLTVSSPGPANLLRTPEIAKTLGKRTALAKGTSLPNGSIQIDTLGQTIRITSVSKGLLKTSYDTVIVRLDDKALDAIENNENIISVRGSSIYTNGKVETYAITDLDNDGVVNGESKYANRARMSTSCTYAQKEFGHSAGEVESLIFEVDAGSDHNFDVESDNKILRASWSRVLRGDTLANAAYADADGDGIVSGPAGIPYTIDATYFEKNNPLKPLTEYGRISCRIMRAEDGTEKTVKFAAEEKFRSGRKNRVWVVDEKGDSTISNGEKAYVYLATNSPAVSDTEITAHVLFVIDPGKDLGMTSDNLLHEIHVKKECRLGDVKTFDLNFVANPPVLAGTQPKGGTFDLKVVYIDGKTASLQGTYSEGKLAATYVAPDGTVTQVTIDKTGN